MSLYKKSKNGSNAIKLISLAIIFICLFAILYVINDKSAIIASIDEDFFSVKITVTKDFGDSIVFSKDVGIEAGETGLDGLEKVADITASYSGGFVESINGIKSTYDSGKGSKNDWFFYINGMLAPIGVADYILHPGDIERWDFHYWGSDRKITAIVADYPEPFLHGFQGNVRITNIVYSELFFNEANNLKNSLNNYGVSVSLKSFDNVNNNDKSNSNLILIDTTENDLIQELNKNGAKLGWFIEFSDKELITFNRYGEKDLIFDHGGFIVATQNPWNPKGNWNGENVVWIISGIKPEDVTQAANYLISNNIENCSSIVIIDQNIYKVP